MTDEKTEKTIRRLAKGARSEAIFAIFLAGFIVGPIALLRIASARRLINKTGVGKDLLDHLKTSQIIAIVATALWVIGLPLKFMGAF